MELMRMLGRLKADRIDPAKITAPPRGAPLESVRWLPFPSLAADANLKQVLTAIQEWAGEMARVETSNEIVGTVAGKPVTMSMAGKLDSAGRPWRPIIGGNFTPATIIDALRRGFPLIAGQSEDIAASLEAKFALPAEPGEAKAAGGRKPVEFDPSASLV